MTTNQWIALAAVLITALIGWLPFHYQIRKDARDRDEKAQQDTRQAVLDALAPVTDERNYLRTQLAAAQRRNEELEDQLRSRDDRP
jgi:hypothetical protein